MNIEIQNDIITIFLDGRIDSNNANEIEAQIMNALSKNPKVSKIQIDVEKLDYISSAGLRILLKLRKQIKNSLPVFNASNEIYEIFNVTGFTELLDVHKKMREVSLEGCELIGAGGFGNVYRIDPETIVKIYKPEFNLEFVEHERNISQKAFLMGVPTAISYDVVKCGDSYGVVYEMLNAKTAAQIINEDPGKIPEICSKVAGLLKELHKIVPDSNFIFPKFKQQLLNWVDAISDFLTEAESEKIKAFICSIPDCNTFLHRDYNLKNIMLQNGELRLIDLGSASIGNPIFDIAGLIDYYKPIFEVWHDVWQLSIEMYRSYLGFDLKYGVQVLSEMCGTYFGLSSQEEIENVTQKLLPYSFLILSYEAFFSAGTDHVLIQSRIESAVRKLLLPSIDHAHPLNF